MTSKAVSDRCHFDPSAVLTVDSGRSLFRHSAMNHIGLKRIQRLDRRLREVGDMKMLYSIWLVTLLVLICLHVPHPNSAAAERLRVGYPSPSANFYPLFA